ncbi:MAG: prepilin-type N-terminal cleavage/methylation domain-containing protein [Patescibacteria group bacterium]
MRNFGNKNKKLSKGFTLLELLLVIAGIGILATIVFVVLDPATTITKTNNAKRLSDVQGILSAMELYSFDHDGNRAGTSWDTVTYDYEPICYGTTNDMPITCTSGSIDLTAHLLTDAKYLSAVPFDPSLISTPPSVGGDSGYEAKVLATGVVTIRSETNTAASVTAKFNP